MLLKMRGAEMVLVLKMLGDIVMLVNDIEGLGRENFGRFFCRF